MTESKHIKHLLSIINRKISDERKASLILDYIIKNKIDIVSYGEGNLSDNERDKYETLSINLFRLKNYGYFDDFCFIDSKLVRLMEKYIAIYNSIHSDKSDVDIAIDLLSLGVSSKNFYNDFHNLYLIADCDKRFSEYRKYLSEYPSIYDLLLVFEMDGIFENAKIKSENDHIESVILEYVRGNFVFLDDFLNFKGISLEEFNSYVRKIKDINADLYDEYLNKRQLNECKIDGLIDEYIGIYNIIYSDKSDMDKAEELVSLGVLSWKFKRDYYYLTVFTSDSRYFRFKDYFDSYYHILSVIEGYERSGLFDTVIKKNKEQEYIKSVILEYVRGNFVLLDDFLNSKGISLEEFNSYGEKVKEFDIELYNEYISKRESNDIKAKKISKEKSKSLLYSGLITIIGFSEFVAKKIVKNDIFLNHTFTNSSISDFVYFFNSYGFDIRSIKNMVKKNNGLLLKNNSDIYNTFNILLSYGFDKDSIILICSNDPFIFDLSRDDIIKRISLLSLYGFSADGIRNILLSLSDIRKISFDVIEGRFNIFYKFNYSQEDIVNIISVCPSLLVSSCDSLFVRLKFYRDFGLDNLLFESNSLSCFDRDIRIIYARICYYKPIPVSLRNINIIMSKGDFFRDSLGAPNCDLLKKYPLPSEYLAKVGCSKKSINNLTL